MKTPEEMAEQWCAEHTCHLQMTCHANAFLAGYAAAQPKWISVFTKTPPIEKDGDESLKVLTIDKWGDIDVLFWDWMDWQNMDVTHWMPLPEPLKENE